MDEANYKRLTRERTPRQFTIATVSRVSLWLGGDHLLLVERSGFTETYKRFYFRDIQAITIQKTSRRSVWNGVLAVPLAICLFGLVVSLTSPRNTTGMVVSSILVTLTLIPFLLNNLRGPACACQLRTAVQTEDLGSLSRVRQTQKVLEKIRPLIVAAQGSLSPEEVAARMHQAASPQLGTTPAEAPPASAPPVLS